MRAIGLLLAALITGRAACAQSVALATQASQNQPNFLATLSGNQSVSSGVNTKVTFNSVTFDTAAAYDAVTNFRYTPLTAGKYLVHVHVVGNWTTGASGDVQGAKIEKNGSIIAAGNLQNVGTTAQPISSDAIMIVQMNGSTDYVEGWAAVTAASAPVVVGGASGSVSYFEAHYLSP